MEQNDGERPNLRRQSGSAVLLSTYKEIKQVRGSIKYYMPKEKMKTKLHIVLLRKVT